MANSIRTIQTVPELRAEMDRVRRSGRRIGLVPTMGYLHDGHLSLVEIGQLHADYVVVSIFVNPTQFGPNEDLDKYPRDFEGDKALLERAGVNLIFTPAAGEIYPDESFIQFRIDKLADHLCGASRPGHFAGVLQVVAKLFNLIQPDVAVFGQKDLQQLVLIKRMAYELNFPLQIVAGPTVRESDGLAMSSRNTYLTTEQREQSTVLYRSLQRAKALIQQGERKASIVLREIGDLIHDEFPESIDYAQVVNLRDLQPVALIDGQIAIALAVRVGSARLIDNIVLSVEGDHVEEISALA